VPVWGEVGVSFPLGRVGCWKLVMFAVMLLASEKGEEVLMVGMRTMGELLMLVSVESFVPEDWLWGWFWRVSAW